LQAKAVKKLAEKLENVTIIKKGKVDIISDGKEIIFNDSEGSLKRCGGIGDLLTGTLGTFINWTHKMETDSKVNDIVIQPNIIAALAGSLFIRECGRVAFNKYHRSVLAVDIVEQLPEVFYQMFDKE
jgi:ATP-dependent NAD(P)H-hydrate dehydratase